MMPARQEPDLPFLQALKARGGEATDEEICRHVTRQFPELTRADLELRYADSYAVWESEILRAGRSMVGREVQLVARKRRRMTDAGRRRVARQAPSAPARRSKTSPAPVPGPADAAGPDPGP